MVKINLAEYVHGNVITSLKITKKNSSVFLDISAWSLYIQALFTLSVFIFT